MKDLQAISNTLPIFVRPSPDKPHTSIKRPSGQRHPQRQIVTSATAHVYMSDEMMENMASLLNGWLRPMRAHISRKLVDTRSSKLFLPQT
jgi:hypothetical protein